MSARIAELPSICILIPGFGDGGAQKQCIRTINALSDIRDARIDVVYFYEGVHFNLLRERASIRLHRVDVKNIYSPVNIMRINRVIRELGSEIIMTWLHSCDVYGAFLKLMNPKLKWMMTERDSEYPFDFRYLLRRRLGRYADVIVANSEAGRRYWLNPPAHSDILVIPNIIEHAEADDRLPPVEPIDVVYVGRLEDQKNVQTVVSAFCALAERRPELTFAVIGDGVQRSLLAEGVARRLLQSQIRFLGFRQDAGRLIVHARVLVSLSHHEGAPNVVLEAVAAGTPVVASDIPEHRDLLGLDYPLYVGDRMSSNLAAVTIERALEMDDPAAALSHGRAKLSEMTAQVVAARYHSVFCCLVHPEQRCFPSPDALS